MPFSNAEKFIALGMSYPLATVLDESITTAIADAIADASVSIQTGFVDVQLTGTTAPPPTRILWRLYGERIVSLLIDANGLSTSNSTSLEVAGGTFPAILRPVGNTRVLACPIVDNNTRKMGEAVFPSSGGGGAGGIIFLAPNLDGVMIETNFTDTGIKGIPPGTELIYSL